MSYSEFPHAHYFEHDNRQILILVEKLESEYAEILEKARKAESDASSAVNKVDSYMTTIDARITQQVNTAVDQATRLLKNDFQNLNNKFNEIQNKFDVLRGQVTQSENKINSVAEKLQSDLDTFKFEIRAEVAKRLAKTESTVTDKVQALDRLTATRMLELSEQIVLAMNMVKDSDKAYTDSALSKHYTDIENMVTTRIDAIKDIIQEVKDSQIYNHVGWLWNNLCSMGGFTAIEIYEYGDFNVDMWNVSGVTCEEWFVSGKQKLGYNTGRMFDNMSGRFVDVGTVVHELVNLLNAQGIITNGFNALAIKSKKGRRKHGKL